MEYSFVSFGKLKKKQRKGDWVERQERKKERWKEEGSFGLVSCQRMRLFDCVLSIELRRENQRLG